jgi:cellobiose phosphorylase
VVYESASGVRIEINRNGSIRRVDHAGVIVNLFLGNELEGGPANLWLGRPAAPFDDAPLLGPRSSARYRIDASGFAARGRWRDVAFDVALVLDPAAPAWFWHVTLENVGSVPATLRLAHTQDLALADYGAVRLNEYYVSHYVDYTPLEHASRGRMLAVRQNQPMGGRHPWALIGSLQRASPRFATDARQLGAFAAHRLQHEHSLAGLEDAFSLAPGERTRRGFFVWLEADHPEPSGPGDLAFADRALALDAARPPASSGAFDVEPAPTLFSERRRLAARGLDDAEFDAEFGAERRHEERQDGRLFSFFSGANRHVVTRAKEQAVLRPHGTILRSGAALVPDEASLTTTAWMDGVFHSMVTQGHVSINRFLSTIHSYLGLFRSHGLRVFVERDGAWHLLGTPSAWENAPNACRWVYQLDGERIEVRSWAALERHALGLAIDVAGGAPCRFLVSMHVALNGDDGSASVPAVVHRDGDAIVVRATPDSDVGRRFPEGSFRVTPAAGTVLESVGDDAPLFADGRSRAQPYVVLVTAPSRAIALEITGHLVESTLRTQAPQSDDAFWRSMIGGLELRAPAQSPHAADVARLGEILPWLAHDALVHYLAPRGLEQYSGGGWGTRDVCQGPVELLLATGRVEPVRELLLRVFANQNPDGDWPQWFMFFERERGIRPGESHGDIVFWPLLALAQYLLASDDASILDAGVPFFDAEQASVAEHVERALGVIERRVVAGTALAAYGHGDWNDSLQPADAKFADQLCSAWTVTLHHQMLATLSRALARAGRDADAARLEAAAARVRADFERVLIVDGVLAGLAHFETGRVEPLLHPADQRTGIRASLLPMIHAVINDLFTPAQARAHVDRIHRELLGPDGARLFDRPVRYDGGRMHLFQRAETATFFGREIGVMYMHAHLRYAEAMARFGDADALFLALRQMNPIGLREVVPIARPRQANCYASSSDACFRDREEASARYGELLAGRVPVEAGWRVYSSGAGIALRLVRECLLGIRLSHAQLGVDPVLPRALDGLRAAFDLGGRTVEVEYRVGARGCGPTALTLNGTPLAFERDANPYRSGAAVVAMEAVRAALGDGANALVVELG